MAIEIPASIVEELYELGSVAGFVVAVEPSQLDMLREALGRVKRRGFDEIPFPDAPEEGPLAGYSSLERTGDGFSLWFDMPDAEAYRLSTEPVVVDVADLAPADSYGIDQPMERLVAILLEELRGAGIETCVVTRYPIGSGDPEDDPVPEGVRASFDDGLPAGLPQELVAVLRQPPFGLDERRSTSMDRDGWSIHLGVDGPFDRVSTDLERALSDGDFQTRALSLGPMATKIAFTGAGQRGEVEIHRQQPLSVHISGQPDEIVEPLEVIGFPAGAQPVVARHLSDPDRLEMTIVYPDTLEATVAFYHARLPRPGGDPANATVQTVNETGPGPQIAMTEIRYQTDDAEASVQLIELADKTVFGAISVLHAT